MSYRLLESGNRPSADVGDSTEARLELEPLADSAGPRNIVLALARFTSDRSENLEQQGPRNSGVLASECESASQVRRRD